MANSAVSDPQTETMDLITESEIRDKLQSHYSTSGIDRELVKNVRRDSHGDVGSIVYSLDGSPPKGYAIAIPGKRKVNFYDMGGKRFREMTNTEVDWGGEA